MFSSLFGILILFQPIVLCIFVVIESLKKNDE